MRNTLIQNNSDEKPSRKTKYTTVHIPEVLAVLIDRLIGSEEFAYSSRSEFVKDAIRRFLEYHGYYPQSGLSLEKLKVTLNPSAFNNETGKVVADINARIRALKDLKTALDETENRK